jgi:sarcosine oxidase, subunit beta
MAQSCDVAIIGGGITGCAAAYELATAGVNVTVIEQYELATMGSGRTLAGVRQSGRHADELPLAIAAVKRWQQLGEELGSDLEYRQHGNLRLAEDDADVELIRLIVGQQRELGLDVQFLEGNDAVRDVAPALSESIQAASFTPTDGHANPIATVRAYADAASRAGAHIQTGTTVTGLETQNGRIAGVHTDSGSLSADRVVVACGIETPKVLRFVSLEFPISLALVPVVQTVPIAPLLDQVLGTAKAHFAARQEAGGRMRFSSGGHAVDITPDEVTSDLMQPGCGRAGETLIRGASIIPELSGVPVNQIWGGLVDLTADGVPVIDEVSEVPGLYVAAGFCGHGFCLGPVSGEIIADLIQDRKTRFALEPFRWNRFVAQEQTRSPELLG